MRKRILLPPLFLSPGIYCNKATFITRGKGVTSTLRKSGNYLQHLPDPISWAQILVQVANLGTVHPRQTAETSY